MHLPFSRGQAQRFTAEFKLEVLREADRCTEPGSVDALLRQHGWYSSHLTTSRRERDQGALAQLERKCGRKSTRHPLDERVAQLREGELEAPASAPPGGDHHRHPKKVAEILGIPLNSPPLEGDD